MVRDASYGSMQPMPMNILVDDVLSCGSDYLSVVASVQSVRRYCRKKMEGEVASEPRTSKQASSKIRRRLFDFDFTCFLALMSFQMPWRLSISRFFEHQMADGSKSTRST